MTGVFHKKAEVRTLRQTCTEGRYYEETEREDGHLQAKERGLQPILPSWPAEETDLANLLISDFLAPEGQTDTFLLCGPLRKLRGPFCFTPHFLIS